jgi:hypothetical protein
MPHHIKHLDEIGHNIQVIAIFTFKLALHNWQEQVIQAY